MTQTAEKKEEPSILTRSCIAALGGYVAYRYSPIMESGVLNPLPTLGALFCAGNGIRLIALGLKRVAALDTYKVIVSFIMLIIEYVLSI